MRADALVWGVLTIAVMRQPANEMPFRFLSRLFKPNLLSMRVLEEVVEDYAVSAVTTSAAL